MLKNPPANAEDVRDPGSIPGPGRSLGEGKATHSSFLAWESPWTEEPGGLQGKPMDRGAWWATICGAGVAKSWTQLTNLILTCL